jgi:hypothetical protein
MNDALALCPDQTRTLNLDDEKIHSLYEKHSLDSSSRLRAYKCLHALLKKAKMSAQLQNSNPAGH